MNVLSKEDQFDIYKVCFLTKNGWKFNVNCVNYPWSKYSVIRTSKEAKQYYDCYEKRPKEYWFNEFSLDEAYELQQKLIEENSQSMLTAEPTVLFNK
jgi:hypothetical protein